MLNSLLTKNDLKRNDFLLVFNISQIEELGNYASKQIITFDYASHFFLENKKIPHVISENFSTYDELKHIENKIYFFNSWYEISSIKSKLLYDDINLGELFFLEFRDQLVSFLKSFIELKNFFQKNSNSHYYVSEELWELVSNLKLPNIKKIIKNKKKSDIYNSVDIPIKFGSKQFTVSVSSNNFSKLKNFINKISNVLISSKNSNSNFSSILIVNFSTLKSKKFLKKSSEYKLNIVKFDRTMPAIWNKETLNIIKNSNSIIENENSLLNKNSKIQIKQNEDLFLNKIESILNSEDLENHFSINGVSFWPSLKPMFTRLIKKRILESAKEIELIKNLMKKHSFSKIILLNESGMTEQIIINYAKQKHIPTFQMQHGLYFDSDENIPENVFQRIIPQTSDYFISWGNIFTTYLEKNHFNSNKIKTLGSIFFENLFEQNFSTSKNLNNILLACDPLAFNRFYDSLFNQKEEYRFTIEKICKITSKTNNKLTIKTHPQKNQYEFEIAKKINPDIEVHYSGDIQHLIQFNDLVIVTDLSTVIIESMIMQKPVISIRIKDHYGKPEIFNYCEQIDIDSLESWLKSYYSNPNKRNELISKGNQFLKIYLKNQSNSSDELLKLLEENQF